MTRDKIFQAAKAVHAQEGISGLSMRAVAKAAGLSPMALYRHFEDKDALVNALMQDGFAAWEEIARALDEPDPLRWLQTMLEAFLSFALSQPHRFDAAFLLPASEARRYPDDFAAGRSPVIAMAMARIDAAKAQGHFGDAPTLEIALALSALATGLVAMHRASRFAGEAEFIALYRQIIATSFATFVHARRES